MPKARLLDVKPSERGAVAACFGLLAFQMAAHTLAITARDTLVLDQLGAQVLPLVTLAIAVMTPIASLAPLERLGPRGLAGWMGLTGVASLAFWAWAGVNPTVAGPVLYIWTGFTGSVSIVLVWQAVARRFHLQQAKRLFGVIGAGSVSGAVVGGALGSLGASLGDVRHLLLGSAVMAVASGLVGLRIRGAGRKRPRGARPPLLDDFRRVLEHPYTKRLALLGLVATTALTTVDYLFKETLAGALEGAQLGVALGGFYAGMNLLALVIQLVATTATIRTLGVRWALAILPLFLLGGAVGVLGGAALIGALILKASDGSLRHTLYRTTLEVLRVPIPEVLRAPARRLNDLFIHRVAQGIASLGILAVLALGGGGRTLAVGLAVCAVAWMVIAYRLRAPYLALFREVLSREDLPEGLELPRLDLAALEALIMALDSEDDREVLTAMELLARAGRARLVPGLLLFHPSRVVVLRALELFSRHGREDLLPRTHRLYLNPDPLIRAAVVRVQPDPSFALQALQDPAPEVRCTALVELLGRGGPQGISAQYQLDAVLQGGSARDRRSVAMALGAQSVHEEAQLTLLGRLAADLDAEVREAACAAMEVRPDLRYIPVLLPLLGQLRARGAARRVLAGLGERAFGPLVEALQDPETPIAVRTHLPKVISDLPGGEPAAFLVQQLNQQSSGLVRWRILRALNTLRAERPELELDAQALEDACRRDLVRAWQLLDWSMVLESHSRESAGHTLLRSLVGDKLASSGERIFRLLDLIAPDEDFEKIYRGLASMVPDQVASSLELLGHVAPPALRVAVVGLVDPGATDLPRLERMKAAKGLVAPGPSDYQALLQQMIESSSDSVQAIAAWHAAELGLVELRPILSGVTPSSPEIAEVLGNAVGRLDDATEEVTGEA